MDKNIIMLSYIVFIGPLSIALFLYGFFPLMYCDNTIATQGDIPKFIENTRVKIDTLYEPIAKRLIVMIIDALRWDFIKGSVGKIAMPVTNSLIANSSAYLLQTKVQPPTVTMPRIKAITTGMIPSFIDVALNFGSKPVTGDSLLFQAKKAGYKSVFYGDDTWITLFPSIFDRYDGTTSFFVTDFTEVDDNVTRHIHKELYNNNDWSIMILHYLGLDHIGHVHGPFSPLIKTKLKEMDNVIAKIQIKVQEWNQNNDSTVFIICGDHGMKDSGGHGGSTVSETTVPFVIIGTENHQNYIKDPIEISQIDIASTLSVILGVPIPYSNIGTVFLDALYNLPISKKLFILYYNSKQVFNHFQKLVGYESKYAYHKYLEAIKLHNAWLNTKDHPDDMTDDIVLSYKAALKGMKEILISSIIICILVGETSFKSASLKGVAFFISLNVLLWLIVNCFWKYESTALLHTNPSEMGEWLLSFGTLIHAISFIGTSFVEEEHQTWYFYWSQALCFSHYQRNAQISIKLFLLLIGHRILRKLNSTGDKYAHLPDIAGFLIRQESRLGMTIVLIAGLALLMWIDFIHENKTHKKLSLVLNFIISICIYLRHMHNNRVAKIPFYPPTRGIFEVQIFWFLLVMNLVKYIYELICIRKRYSRFFPRVSLYFILQTWIMIAAMLHQPHNVILLPFQIIFSSVIYEIIKNNTTQNIWVLLYIWIGNVFYFYQGNSNSLATVDVAAGYVGVQSYMPFINGSLLIINTYAAPLLSYFLLIYHAILQHPHNIQRHHLFVWSVFSPKLLYEAVHSTVVCSAVFIMLILATVQKAINNCNR
ncbi:GPI ethanolamine phosphate transferase 2 [Melipona quadrifasciata]|uniref:GPI ethanolamine phosphate transferase 2 n=1 Tax=Melipona quadrifasciata TaxID=166423 RepID=A0A0M8ZUR4_9HYME|nr:GPI ethanolamine phosphate transferase 2 [Melipona quadrifasciata]